MSMIIKIVGIVIIVISFIFILCRPDQSLMDTMMKKRKKDIEKMMNNKDE